MNSKRRTSVYLVPYHSEPGLHLEGGTGQFATVEKAIVAGEWPYDNGDDPSFYVAKNGGPLTWGVCRQELRNSIEKGSIVVFFSYTSHREKVLYRLSAVATVADIVDRRIVFTDSRFRLHAHCYLNTLIKPAEDGWRYDESDRNGDAKHRDWLWRIALHDRKKKPFKTKNKTIYQTGEFRDGQILVAENYVVFSSNGDETYITQNPPKVATVKLEERKHEKWSDCELQRLTVDEAGKRLASGRNYLRVANRSGRNVHRQIHFRLPPQEARTWRQSLISVLRKRP